MRRIFADASGWIALNSRRDQLNRVSVEVNRALLQRGVRYVTTNFVLDETYTGLRTRVSHQAAVDFGERIRSSRTIQVVYVTEELEEEAWNLFKGYSDKEFSFTDCTSFVVMRRLGLVEAFTGDHHFEQMGFVILLRL